jgi:hypothetical protein
MKKENKNQVVVIIAAVLIVCVVLLCLGVLAFSFFFGVSSSAFFSTEAATETSTLSDSQLEQCRETLAIKEGIELEGEYYLYTPGFLDDSLECHVQARGDSLQDIFDLSVVDPSQTTNQEISPGRFLHLSIEMIEPGLYRIEGFWFQT